MFCIYPDSIPTFQNSHMETARPPHKEKLLLRHLRATPEEKLCPRGPTHFREKHSCCSGLRIIYRPF